MKVGILGSGMVGQIIGSRLVELGHAVVIGTRDPHTLDEPRRGAASLREWAASVGAAGQVGSFAEAAAHGEIVINATNGLGSLQALGLAGAANLAGKVLIDIANQLEFANGMPHSLANDEVSLAENIQRAFPDALVVKALNTMNANIMVNPQQLANGDHTVFISGNNEGAKAQVAGLLQTFGWRDIMDLGDLSSARGTEMLLPIWLRLWGRLGDRPFNFKIVR